MPIQNGQKPVYNIIAPIKISLFEEKVAVFQKNRRCLMYLRGIETSGSGDPLRRHIIVPNVPKRNRDRIHNVIDLLSFQVPNVPKRNRDWQDRMLLAFVRQVPNVPKRNRDYTGTT